MSPRPPVPQKMAVMTPQLLWERRPWSQHKTGNTGAHTALVTLSSVYNNSHNNNQDDIYSAVIMTTKGHCESSLGSSGECRAAPSGRRPSDQAT